MSATDREGKKLVTVRNGEQLHALRRVAYRALELQRALDAMNTNSDPMAFVEARQALRQAIAAKLATPTRETAHPRRRS